MRKAFVMPTIHFKGSGWAKVDRRSTSGATKSASSEAGPGVTGTKEAASPDDSRAGGSPSTPGDGASTVTPSKTGPGGETGATTER